MGKCAFVFPGQGSQYSGMGKEMHDAFSCARDAFDEASQALGLSLQDLCFKGPEEVLKLTRNTQPAILTVSIAILRILQSRGLSPSFVAGHSLGEYSALVCAEALTLGDAARLVRNRGEYMQAAVPPGKGMMSAVLGLVAPEVELACHEAASEGIVSPANYNAPDQVVIAGEVSAVTRAGEIARQRGAKRVMPLPVSAPFHCALMAPARERLAVDLARQEFRDLEMPLIANAGATRVETGAEARASLIRQVCEPVRWVETIRNLVHDGVDTFVEVGPGRVLTGLVKKIAPQVRTFSADGIRGIEALASELPDGTM